MPPPQRNVEAELLAALEGPAPTTSIVKAAKASLKEPSRPFTPADVGRSSLFMSDGYTNRPSTSMSQMPSPSMDALGRTGNRFSPSPLHSPGSGAGAGLPPLGSGRAPSVLASSGSLPELRQSMAFQSPGMAGRRTSGNSMVFTSQTVGESGASAAAQRYNAAATAPPPAPPHLQPRGSASPFSGAATIENRSLNASLHRPAKSPMEHGSGGHGTGHGAGVGAAGLRASQAGSPASPAGGYGGGFGVRSSRIGAPAMDASGVSLTSLAGAPQVLTINHSHGQGHDPSALRMSGSGDALADVLAGASLSPHGSDEVGAEDGGANGSGGGAGNASTSWRCEVERCLQELGTAIDRSQRGCTRSDLDGLARRTAALKALADHAAQLGTLHAWLGTKTSAYVDSRGARLALKDAVVEQLQRLFAYGAAELVLKACGLLLRIAKSGSAAGVTSAKLMYMLSKDTANDGAFLSEGLIDGILEVLQETGSRYLTAAAAGNAGGAAAALATEEANFVIYLAGCLKNISNDGANQKALLRQRGLHVLGALLGALGAATAALQRAGAAAEADGRAPALEAAVQVTAQVSGVLRNLAASPAHAAAFLEAEALQSLRRATSALLPQSEVALNASRIWSKLSLNPACQAAMESDAAFVPLLVSLLDQHSRSPAIVIRTAFVLGNLTTSREACRDALAAVPGVAGQLAGLLAGYALQGAEALAQGAKADKISRAATREDCITKVLRLVANAAIHPALGRQLAAQPAAADALASILETYSLESQEELVLNAAAAISNLSFYADPPGGAPTNQLMMRQPQDLLGRLAPLLLADNEEAVVEAARACGNFARSQPHAAFLRSARLGEALLLLLDHNDWEVVLAAAGAVINTTLSTEGAGAFLAGGGVAAVLALMERCMMQGELFEVHTTALELGAKLMANVLAVAEPEAVAEGLSIEDASTLAALLRHMAGAAALCETEALQTVGGALLAQLEALLEP